MLEQLDYAARAYGVTRVVAPIFAFRMQKRTQALQCPIRNVIATSIASPAMCCATPLGYSVSEPGIPCLQGHGSGMVL